MHLIPPPDKNQHSKLRRLKIVEIAMLVASSVKLYLLLVLLPQFFWLLSSGKHGFSVMCDSCSFSQIFHEPTVSPGNARSPGITMVNATDELCSCEKSPWSRTAGDTYHELEERGFSDDELGGWYIPHSLPDLTGPCTIKRRDSSLNQCQFLKEFAFTEPVILVNMSDQQLFRTHSTKYRLLKDYGHEMITVATANTHSYRRVQMTLCEYVQKVMKAQTYDGLGNETLYHFGDNDRDQWDPLFSLYHLPPLPLPNKEPVLSFGLAGPGTGVPFHVHGPTYAETIYGRKRWFLYPPSSSPPFHPDKTTLHWFTHTYPSLLPPDIPLECTLHPGEILYLPDRWWHSTLNVDSVVFMSVFYS